ncbi:MAG: DUF6265 family protein [Bacteroidales bacterium]|nr:DUF6265 family protein [Bacteroidales bacterium]
MKSKKIANKFLAAGLILLLAIACTSTGPQLPLWLEGTWATGDSIGLTAESWEKINDHYMSGEGLFATSDGKSVVEILNIFIQEGTLVYTALVPNENNGHEIIFTDTQLNPDSLVFNNPGHDYPKKIIYHRAGEDKVNVYLYGNKKEADKLITLKKVKK